MGRYTKQKFDDGIVLVTPSGSHVGALLFRDDEQADRIAQYLEMGYAAGVRDTTKAFTSKPADAVIPIRLAEVKPTRRPKRKS